MKYAQRVITSVTDQPPEGWDAKLFPPEYEALDPARKAYYSPVYAKYRTKKYRAYGEYGDYLGWEEMQIGIGQPVGYIYHGVITASVVDTILKGNVVATRMLADPQKWRADVPPENK